MTRKAKKSEIKVESFTEQNKKNEAVFKKTENYGKKVEDLNSAIKGNAAVFTRLVQNNPYEDLKILKQRQDASGVFDQKLPFEFKINNGEATVQCYSNGYVQNVKLDLIKLGNVTALGGMPSDNLGSRESCLKLVNLLKHNPLKAAAPLILNIDVQYEKLLELDKRDESASNTGDKKEGHTRLGNLLKVMQKTLGLNQYGGDKPQVKDSKDDAKGNFMDLLWSVFPGSVAKTQDKKQAESTGAAVSESSSNALAVVNVDSKNFEDVIDEGFQRGVDDFYALAKASCYDKAIVAVKTYSSCLMRGKETGGTEGCLKYQYHSEDLLEFCGKSFTYETNAVVDKLITDKLAEAQKIEYNYENQKLLAHSDSALFEAASNQLLIDNGDAEDVLTSGVDVSCVNGVCGALPDTHDEG